MLISQNDFLKILTEKQDIILGTKTLQDFKNFLLEEYKEVEHICFLANDEILFMEDETSFSSYIKIIFDNINNQFQFYFENEDYESISEAPEYFKKHIAYIALDTIKALSKWQNLVLNEQLAKKIFTIDETHQIHKTLCDHFKITNKYKNLTFEISYSGEPIEDISTSTEEDSSDFDWI